jgi:hypothetical protein
LSAIVVAQLATGAALLAVLPTLIVTGRIAAAFLLEALAGLFALALSPPFDALISVCVLDLAHALRPVEVPRAGHRK